jgi:hypothetical protein
LELGGFVAWLLGSTSQKELDGGTGRSFRDTHAWCWNVVPQITVTGEVFDQIELDGIYLSGGWCCLIAWTPAGVVGWQWCDTEKKAAWMALLNRLPAPAVAVCDGGPGLLGALKDAWPDTMAQRCLVHVQRNVRTHLTSNPRTEPGRALWGLARALTRIGDAEAAAKWLANLNAWFQVHGPLVKQRTYAATTADRPDWARPNQQWWYTHDRLRRAYRLMERLAQDGALFTYLDPALAGLGIASTTNRIEGGVNAQLRLVARHHRGMPITHRRRAFEWWLWDHAAAKPALNRLIKPHHWQPTKPTRETEPGPDGPALYDTNTTPEEGLWARKGWAGRSN